MSLTSQSTEHVRLSVSIEQLPWGSLLAEVSAFLPGTEGYRRQYFCDPKRPDEASAFYDDVVKDTRVWAQLLAAALEDRCFTQGRLWR